MECNKERSVERYILKRTHRCCSAQLPARPRPRLRARHQHGGLRPAAADRGERAGLDTQVSCDWWTAASAHLWLVQRAGAEPAASAGHHRQPRARHQQPRRGVQGDPEPGGESGLMDFQNIFQWILVFINGQYIFSLKFQQIFCVFHSSISSSICYIWRHNATKLLLCHSRLAWSGVAVF